MSDKWTSSLSENETRSSALRKAEAIKDKREREKAIAAWCWSIFNELKEGKYEIAGENHSKWNRWLDQASGDQVPDRRDGRPKPKDNFTQQLNQEEMPIFVDVGVNIEIHPRQADDLGKASVVQDALDYVMDAVKLPVLDRRGAGWMQDLGTIIPKAWWDRDADGGIGNVRTAIMDPRKCYPSPGASTIEACWAFATLDDVDADEMVRRYPKRREDLLKATSSVKSEGGNRRGTDMKITKRFGRPVQVMELWYRDPKTDRDEAVDLGDTPGKPEYPDGRVFIVSGDLVLRDTPNPFGRNMPVPGHGQFPYVSGQNIDRRDSIFGIGNVEYLDSEQNQLDMHETMIANYDRLMHGNFVEMSYGSKIVIQPLPKLQLTVIKTKKGGRFEFRQPPPLPEYIYSNRQNLRDRMRDRLGGGKLDVSEITKRAHAVGALQMAQDTIEKNPKAKIDNKNQAWADWARQVLSLLRQFMPNTRIERLSNGRTVRIDPEILRSIDIERFDIRIVPTGKSIYSRAIQFAVAAQLDKMQVLGPIESMRRKRFLAETSGVKGAVQVLDEEMREQEKMAEMQQLAIEMAAQNAARGAPGLDIPPGAPGMPPGIPPVQPPGASGTPLIPPVNQAMPGREAPVFGNQIPPQAQRRMQLIEGGIQ